MVAGRLPFPRLVHPCRSPGGIFEVSLTITVFRTWTLRSRLGSPALVGFAPLSNEKMSPSPRSIGPSRLSPTASLGIRQSLRSVPLHRLHQAASALSAVLLQSERPLPRSPRADFAVSHDFVGFFRRSTRRFVAPCCRSWGSMRFGACARWFCQPRNNHIAVPVPAGHRAGTFPASTFLPPEGSSSPAAVECRHSTLPPRTLLSRRSAMS